MEAGMWLVGWLAGCTADAWRLGDQTIALPRDGAPHAERPQGASASPDDSAASGRLGQLQDDW